MFFKKKSIYRIVKISTGFIPQHKKDDITYGIASKLESWSYPETQFMYCVVNTLEEAQLILDNYKAIVE